MPTSARPLSFFSFALPTMLALAGCGGGDDASSSPAGAAGSSNSAGMAGTTGGAAGASAGGTSAGGTSAGGTSAGGTSAGGSSAGGGDAGGGDAGGTSAGGGDAGGSSAGGDTGAGGAAGSSAGGAGGAQGTPGGFYFTGTGFDEYVGKPFQLAMVIRDEMSLIETIRTVRIESLANGTIYLGFPPQLAAGKKIVVEYLVDVGDVNGCNSSGPPTAMWRKEIVSVADGPTVLEVTNDTSYTDVCGSVIFGVGGGVSGTETLEISGSGFTPHENDNFYAAVVEKPSGQAVAWAAIHPMTGGAFHYTWHYMVQTGKEYAFNYYADISNDGACQPAPTDHAWSRAIPAVTGPVVITDIVHDENFSDVCSSF